MSQGARLKFIRENKGIELNDIAEYLGYKSNKPIREWENNVKSPDARNLPRLAEAYEVSIDSIRDYDLSNPIDLIYIAMWQEELMPYFDINIEDISNNLNEYAKDVVKGLNEWKLNFSDETFKLKITGKGQKDCFIKEYTES